MLRQAERERASTSCWKSEAGRRGCPGACKGRPLVLFLAALRPVQRSALLAIGNTGRIQRAPDDVISDPGQVSDPSSSHQHHRVLLQIMAFSRNEGGYLCAIR